MTDLSRFNAAAASWVATLSAESDSYLTPKHETFSGWQQPKTLFVNPVSRDGELIYFRWARYGVGQACSVDKYNRIEIKRLTRNNWHHAVIEVPNPNYVELDIPEHNPISTSIHKVTFNDISDPNDYTFDSHYSGIHYFADCTCGFKNASWWAVDESSKSESYELGYIVRSVLAHLPTTD